MKKIKIKQRIENAVDAFLADDNSIKNNSISFANDSDLLRNELSADSSAKSTAFGKILKQVFLFFSGNFFVMEYDYSSVV